MRINAISNTGITNINFEGRKKKVGNTPQEHVCNQNCYECSGDSLRKALKAMVLIPVLASPLASCDEYYPQEDCDPIIIFNPTEKPEVPETKDTLYTGHVYNLPKVKIACKNLNGENLDSVTIPNVQAYIPSRLIDAPINTALNNFISVLNLKTSDIDPAEGKSKAKVDNLPLQFIYANPSRQSVSSIKLDGFKSTDKCLAYDEMEYNSNGNIKSSVHYDVIYVNNNTLVVEKYDNFNPTNGVKKELLQLDGDKVNRFVNIRNNEYVSGGTITKGDSRTTLFLNSEDINSKIEDIKVRVSDT